MYSDTDSDESFLSANEEDGTDDKNDGPVENFRNMSIKNKPENIFHALSKVDQIPELSNSKNSFGTDQRNSSDLVEENKCLEIRKENCKEDFVRDNVNVDHSSILTQREAMEDRPSKFLEPKTKINDKLKKPRKKLGEKLVNKKPLVGFSCDDFVTPVSSINQSTKEVEVNSSLTCVEGSKKGMTNEIQESNWSSWGDWSSSLLSAAASVSQDLSNTFGNVLDTVPERSTSDSPTSIGESEAKVLTEDYSESEFIADEKCNPSESGLDFGIKALGSFVSNVSGVFESASNTVLLGGLDALELIGKKTMDFIQEGDPGLRRKRSFLNLSKPNLSSILKDAREKAMEEEQERRLMGGTNEPEKKDVLQLVWDNTEGPAHLDALSLIAKQCSDKNSLLMRDLSPVWREKLQGNISKIMACSSLEDCEVEIKNVEKTLLSTAQDVKLPLPFNKIIMAWPALQDYMDKLSIEISGGLTCGDDGLSIQDDAGVELCTFTSHAVALVHKTAEVALITPGVDNFNVISQIQRLCRCISVSIESSADEICEALTRVLPSCDVITNLYVLVAQLNSNLESALSCLASVLVHIETKSIWDKLQ